jgi:2-polyprenyl-3-methyl-5-hydroxy-6-metoxy-1,4-benzoquinol methylase
MVQIFLVCAFAAVLSAQDTGAPDDATVWRQFESWTAALPAFPPGQRIPFGDRYIESLKKEGVSEAEARRRLAVVGSFRRGSDQRERVYWDASFKSGGGPDDPLLLLQETVRKLKPGRVLDAGMGRGRNTIFLASLGWDATGYDMSVDALKVAQAYAEKAGVKIKTVEAKHDTFDFGEAQWDLILCAYCYMMPDEPNWPEVFWKALKPGGVVVFQTSVAPRKPVSAVASHWKRFRVLRVEDIDAGVVDNDWSPSRTNPTVKLVARKEAR